MKPFLKVFLIIMGVVLCLRLLLRMVFGLGLALAALAFPAVVLGLGLVVALICAAFGLITALAPIWLPALAIVGLVALWKKSERAT